MSPCAIRRFSLQLTSSVASLVLVSVFVGVFTSSATATLIAIGEPTQYDFSGTDWIFPETRLRVQVRVPGLGRSRAKPRPSAVLGLGDGTWTLRFGSQTFASGTSLHAQPTKRRLDLSVLDDASLRAWILPHVYDLASEHDLQIESFDGHADVALLRLKANHSLASQTTEGRLRIRVKLSGTLEGTLDGMPTGALPWSAVVRGHARSLALPASEILVTTDPEPPVADLWMSGFVGEAPFLVHFQDHSTGTVDSRVWDFGDGVLSNQVNPSYIYEIPGTYIASLEVVGPLGIDLRTQTVTVSDPDNPQFDPPMVLYPASPRGPELGTLTKQLGPDSFYYVGTTAGLGIQFSISLDGFTNDATKFATRMRVSSDRTQVLRTSLVLKRTPGLETVIFDHETVTIPGDGIIRSFDRTQIGEPIDGTPGDRLVWTIWNDTSAAEPVADLRIWLDQSRIQFPRF